MMRLPLLVPALLLAGCAGGPPPEVATPTPDLPPAFFYAPGESTEADLAALLPADDPAFVTLSTYALENSPTLGEALARIDIARSGAARAGAERLPNLNASTGVEASRTNPLQFGANLPPGIVFDSERIAYAANLSASWDADVFGVLRAEERAALRRIDAAEAGAAAVRLALISEIATTVIDWRTVEARERHLRSDVGTAEHLERLAIAREEQGLGAGIDRLRAEGNAATAQTNLAALEGEKRRLLGRLVTLTTLNARIVMAALDTTPPDPQQLLPPPQALPSSLVQNRPDILQAAAVLAAEDAELAATARRRFPRFDLSAVIGLLTFDLSNFLSEDSLVSTLAASVAGPLLDFGRLEAEIDGAAAAKQAAFEAYRGAVFDALGDAEAAYGLVYAADAERAAAERESRSVQRIRDIALAQYQSGLVDFSTVLDATRRADQSGQRTTIRVGQAQRARVILWQTLGGAGRRF